MKATAMQGRKGSEHLVIKGTRFRAPKGSRVKPGRVNVLSIRKGSVLVQAGALRRGARPGAKPPAERWHKAAALRGKAGGHRRSQRRSHKRARAAS